MSTHNVHRTDIDPLGVWPTPKGANPLGDLLAKADSVSSEDLAALVTKAEHGDPITNQELDSKVVYAATPEMHALLVKHREGQHISFQQWLDAAGISIHDIAGLKQAAMGPTGAEILDNDHPQAASPAELLRHHFEVSLDLYYPEWKTNMMATHVERLYHFFAAGYLFQGHLSSTPTHLIKMAARDVVALDVVK